jgi:hypothetical protein
MKIIYLTTAMSEQRFNDYEKLSKIKVNPSNQNFHNKLINGLAKFNNDITVIALRPLSKNMFEKSFLLREEEAIDNIHYIYPYEKTNKVWRKLHLCSSIKNAIKSISHDNKAVIIVDTLNLYLLKAAKNFAKKNKNKIIGIITDNIFNTTNVNIRYANNVYETSTTLDAYLSLTEELNELINVNKKPHYTFEGLIDEYKSQKSPQETPYFFFGGALYERYGVLDLVSAFKECDNNQIDLIIAGHGDLSEEMDKIALTERHIKYLGTINKEEMYRYEQHAIACINPRRFTRVLDKESIPSKVLEYLGNKAIVVSTPNTKLENRFKDLIIWSKSEDLTLNMKKAISLTENDRKDIIKKSYAIIEKNYLKEVQADKILHFIDSLS